MSGPEPDSVGSTVAVGRAAIALNLRRSVPVRRTIVTLGLERGGTSPVAGVLRALGVDLGPTPQEENNNEDYRFHEASLEELEQLVAQRNRERDLWGFKYPRAHLFLPRLERQLRNAYYVVVHRDPVATALSRSRWDGEETERPVDVALAEAATLDHANLEFALTTDRPCLLVSHAAAVSRPRVLINGIADFIGVDRPSPELRGRIEAYLEPGRYKPFGEYFPEA